MKKLINCVFILCFSIGFSQQNTSIPQALNIASKQSMLAARLAKGKIFKATNPGVSDIKQKTNVSLIQFEQNIEILKKMELPSDVQLGVTTLEMLWYGYKKALMDSSPEMLVKTIEYKDVMLDQCTKVYSSILVLSQVKCVYPYNTGAMEFPEAYCASNNLKYLSQNLSLQYNVYYSKLVKFDDDAVDASVGQIDESIVAIGKLKDLASPEIKAKTEAIEKLWVSLREDFTRVQRTNFVITDNYPRPVYIFKQCNKLLEEADLLARLYKANSSIK